MDLVEIYNSQDIGKIECSPNYYDGGYPDGYSNGYSDKYQQSNPPQYSEYSEYSQYSDQK